MRALLVVWLALGALGASAVLGPLARPARADDVREEARREFTAGQAADRRQDYRRAIEHYLRANELVPHHFALYNIAHDYERLGELREAATWYARYLEAAPDSPDRDKVVRLVKELVTRPAKLSVRSQPGGARVTIDGLPVGTTPYAGTIKGGTRRIAVELDGEEVGKEVRVEYGEPVDVELVLRGPTGMLVVRGEPFGAQVTVDGVAVGSLRPTLRVPVAVGERHVRVTSWGYVPHDADVTITRGADTEVVAKLARGGNLPGVTKISAGYLIGVSGGPDLSGGGVMVLGEFGVRVLQYDASLRIGKHAGEGAVDFIVRWAFLKARVSPFIALGYSYLVGGAGFTAAGGLRYDALRNERVGVSVLAEAGLRTHAAAKAPAGDAPGEGGVIFPIMASLQVSYR